MDPRLINRIKKVKNDKVLVINGNEKIKNPKTTINTHLSFLKGQPGNKGFMPYYKRIIKILAAYEV